MVTTSAVRTGARSERWRWLLLPMALLAVGYSLLSMLAAIAGLVFVADVAGSSGPVSVTLHAAQTILATPGQHSYGGGPYVPDGHPVTATLVQAQVAGLDLATRVALKAGPAVWALTLAVVATEIAVTLMRLRSPSSRSAARPTLVAAVVLAVGSSVAQLLSAYAAMRLGSVAFIAASGSSDFSGIGPVTFDLTPLGFVAGLLVAVLLIRRSEQPPLAGVEQDPV